MKIYLIGMPASGKSTFGNLLAEALSLPFLDTDTLIEQQEKMSIPAIFSQKGEAYFRLLEADILRKLPADASIISTGGGMPCFHQNMEFIKQDGKSIFLDVPVRVLTERALHQAGTRPLLATQSEESMIAQLEQKRQERLIFYQQADLILEYPNISTDLAMSWLKG